MGFLGLHFQQGTDPMDHTVDEECEKSWFIIDTDLYMYIYICIAYILSMNRGIMALSCCSDLSQLARLLAWIPCSFSRTQRRNPLTAVSIALSFSVHSFPFILFFFPCLAPTLERLHKHKADAQLVLKCRANSVGARDRVGEMQMPKLYSKNQVSEL